MNNFNNQQKEIIQNLIENLVNQGLSQNQAFNAIITTLKAFKIV
jgi:hypothetical protein